MSILLNAAGIAKSLDDMAERIAKAAPSAVPIALVGIRRRGVPLAERLLLRLRARGVAVELTGALDITLYRDDLSAIGPQAQLNRTEIPFEIDDTWMILVDDVLYTGRSIAAALRALHPLGRPKAVKLAVLVDRGHRELPLHADFIGLDVHTEDYHIIKVKLSEVDSVEEVELYDTREPK